jgi:hypothetical protein
MIILLFRLPLSAQYYRYPLRSAFLSASAGFGKTANAIVMADNPSLVATTDKLSLCAFAENEYGVKGLNLFRIAASLGSKRSGAGMILSRFGNRSYREITAAVYYGKSLGPLSTGLTFRYNNFSIAGLRPEHCAEYTLSLNWCFTPRLFAAMNFTNPYILRFAASAYIAPYYAVSFGYEASESVFAEARFVKETGRDFQACIALHFRFADKWIFHTGCWPLNFRPFVALEWQQSLFRLLIDVSYHPSLGASPGLLIHYEKINQHSDE